MMAFFQVSQVNEHACIEMDFQAVFAELQKLKSNKFGISLAYSYLCTRN